jgi:hypothetical protein
MFPTWLVERGEAVSFMLVVSVLLLTARVVARALGTRAGLVDDQFWWGALAFIVVGRLVEVAVASPALLLDPMVAIRFVDGLHPLGGAAGALGWLWWRARGDEADVRWAAAAVGLVLASVTYSLACPLREACFGATAPAPLGIPLHGLAEPRLPTPLIEAVVLLLILSRAVSLAPRWSHARLGWALLAALAATRLVLTPLSAGGVDVLTMAVLAVATVGAAALALRANDRQRTGGTTSAAALPR